MKDTPNSTQVYRWQNTSDGLPSNHFNAGDYSDTVLCWDGTYGSNNEPKIELGWYSFNIGKWCGLKNVEPVKWKYIFPWEEINTQERETAEQVLKNKKYQNMTVYFEHDCGKVTKSVSVSDLMEEYAQFSTSVPVSGIDGLMKMISDAWDTSREVTIEDSCVEHDEVRDMEFVEFDFSSMAKTKESYLKKVKDNCKYFLPVSEEENRKPTHDELCDLAADVFKDIPADSGLNEIPKAKFNNDQFKRKEGFITGWWYGYEKRLTKKP